MRASSAGTQQVASTLHWGPDFPGNQWFRTHYEYNDAAGFDTDFHVYKLDWTPGMYVLTNGLSERLQGDELAF